MKGHSLEGRDPVQSASGVSDLARPAAVSVIVPFRNPGPYFRPLLQSIIDQKSLEATEIILVDNASTDGSRATAEKIQSRMPLRVVSAPEAINASFARNVGVRAARGDKLLFVDADDELAPGYIAAMSAALDSHDFVTSHVDPRALNDEWLHEAQGEPWEGVMTYFEFLPTTGINVGLRRNVFEAVGGFPEDFSTSQDIVFSWRVHQRGFPVHFVPDAVYRYRYRSTLGGIFQQSRNWGTSNVLLYRHFRDDGMPGRYRADGVG